MGERGREKESEREIEREGGGGGERRGRRGVEHSETVDEQSAFGLAQSRNSLKIEKGAGENHHSFMSAAAAALINACMGEYRITGLYSSYSRHAGHEPRSSQILVSC